MITRVSRDRRRGATISPVTHRNLHCVALDVRYPPNARPSRSAGMPVHAPPGWVIWALPRGSAGRLAAVSSGADNDQSRREGPFPSEATAMDRAGRDVRLDGGRLVRQVRRPGTASGAVARRRAGGRALLAPAAAAG